MAKLVNLRTVRRQRARAEDRARGDAAAARTGGAAAEAEHERAQAELERRRLEGHRRDDPDS
jgi:hypothetical protein